MSRAAARAAARFERALERHSAELPLEGDFELLERAAARFSALAAQWLRRAQ